MKAHWIWLCLLSLLFQVMRAEAQEQKTPILPKTKVFYLKYAEATSVASTIEQLFADAEDAGKIKLIPEVRTNALFVNCSDKVLKDIEAILKILDAEKPPAPNTLTGLKPADEIKVFTLENAVASETLQVVTDLIGKAVQLTADPRTNSLIATGSKQDLAVVEAILLRLDESRGRRSNILKIYPLKFVKVEETVETISRLGLSANLAADSNQRRLLALGDEEAQKLIAEMIETLDVEKASPPAKRLQLRIVWLVDEKLAGKDAVPPSKNLDKVVKVLEEKLGVTNLRMAAQVLVNVDSGAEGRPYTVRGTTRLAEAGSVELAVEGVLNQGRNTTMEISIRAEQASANSGGRFGSGGGRGGGTELASINTIVAAPIGHSIVLGMTPIQSADSVFVLQVLSDDPPAATN